MESDTSMTPLVWLDGFGSLDSDEVTVVADGESRVEYLPAGYLLYARGGALLAHPFDARGRRFTGEPLAIADGIRTGSGGQAHFSVSDRGVLAYRDDTVVTRRLVWVDRAWESSQA